MHTEQDDALPLTWRKYLWVGFKFLLIFYVASFFLGYLFLHRGEHWLLPGILLGLGYVALVIFAAVRMVKQFSMAAVMVASPTIPLCMMILVVSLLPILQYVEQREHATQHDVKAK